MTVFSWTSCYPERAQTALKNDFVPWKALLWEQVFALGSSLALLLAARSSPVCSFRQTLTRWRKLHSLSCLGDGQQLLGKRPWLRQWSVVASFPPCRGWAWPSASSFLPEGAAGLECPFSPCGRGTLLGAALTLMVDAQRVWADWLCPPGLSRSKVLAQSLGHDPLPAGPSCT